MFRLCIYKSNNVKFRKRLLENIEKALKKHNIIISPNMNDLLHNQSEKMERVNKLLISKSINLQLFDQCLNLNVQK